MQDAEEELLNLHLSIATYAGKDRKRKRIQDLNCCNQFNGYDGKVLGFLRTRDHMLKLDPKRDGVEDGKGLHLIHLLLVSATSVDENKIAAASENLTELYKNVSVNGDSIQRVAAYFADGLAARLLTRRSPFYEMIMKDPTPEEEFSAFTELYRASPYYQFAHFTANQAIIEAFEDEEDHNNRSLHVIDFDISYGFQWPSLIQSLSDKALSSNVHISLRITGFGRSSEELVETETRLMNFAKGCHNLDFEFEGLLRGSKSISISIKNNATVAVNLVFYLHTLGSSLQIIDALKAVYLLNPSIVILVEQEGSRTPRSFLSRFMESLHYFAAMFDSLDDCLPSESAVRLSIEKNHLGKEIKGMINCEVGHENYQRYERLEAWKERMESVGFRGVKLSSRSVSQAKLLLKIRSHCSPVEVDGRVGGFKVFERDGGRAISLGWQDRNLITASAWHCI
ncbi:GRAS family protein RAM1-like [Magnolia sinica]|uniref:GRAS family protein RAM1-like n=1 Tax=Magnolia sinica TaxID=86752 RepID=UPI002658BBC9|nr:GRAS family protein RAM1-like [Magnolia sinica]